MQDLESAVGVCHSEGSSKRSKGKKKMKLSAKKREIGEGEKVRKRLSASSLTGTLLPFLKKISCFFYPRY